MKIYLICVALHLMAVMLWIGHMIFWSIFVGPVTKRFDPPQNGKMIRTLSLRYGGLGWPALIILVLTGIYILSYRGLSWELIASGEIVTAPYGKILCFKLILVSGMAIYQAVIGHRPAPKLIYINMAAALIIIALSVLMVRSVSIGSPYWDIRLPQPYLKGEHHETWRYQQDSKILGNVKLTVNSPELIKIISENAQLEMLATGFKFIEGPVFDPTNQILLFSDIPADKIYSWSPATGITVFREPSGKSNGLAFDSNGHLIAAEHATRRISKHRPDGSAENFLTHYDGKRFNSPNDLVIKSDGSIYFTDPPHGLIAEFGSDRNREIAVQGVYRFDPANKKVTVVVDDLHSPNGIAFSKDEKTLYVNDPPRKILLAYDIDSTGLPINERIFAKVPAASHELDGIKVDVNDNVYMTGPGGIWVWNKNGKHLGIILLPEPAANMNWGGLDRKTMYITATSSLYRLKLNVAGAPARD